MGDVILVNGVPWPQDEGQEAHVPLPRAQRVVSRSVPARAQQQPAHDGRRHATAGSCPSRGGHASCASGMAERYELVIDFSQARDVGQQVIMKNLGLPNNVNFARRRT
jgi:hypothetical protein